MKLTFDATLLFLSAVNNMFIYLFMLQGWNMKSTESTNICCTSDSVACSIKMNIKEAFMGNDGLLQMFMW